jgi:hypothetical protein
LISKLICCVCSREESSVLKKMASWTSLLKVGVQAQAKLAHPSISDALDGELSDDVRHTAT